MLDKPAPRTLFISTHLISEFEGLIDEFTILDRGRAVLSLDADQARAQFQKIRVQFAEAPPPALDLSKALRVRQQGRQLEVVVNGHFAEIEAKLRAAQPQELQTEGLSLEEIFLVSCQRGEIANEKTVI